MAFCVKSTAPLPVRVNFWPAAPPDPLTVKSAEWLARAEFTASATAASASACRPKSRNAPLATRTIANSRLRALTTTGRRGRWLWRVPATSADVVVGAGLEHRHHPLHRQRRLSQRRGNRGLKGSDAGEAGLLRPRPPVPVTFGIRSCRVWVPATRCAHDDGPSLFGGLRARAHGLVVPTARVNAQFHQVLIRPAPGDLGPKPSISRVERPKFRVPRGDTKGKALQVDSTGGAPCRECLSRPEDHRPLGGGILELSAEAHTPAMAIRRKIAETIYFHASPFSNARTRIS